jgi:hypothetical protein
VAAWFLHAWLLLALMAAALIGWLVSIVSRPAGSTGAPRSARAVP